MLPLKPTLQCSSQISISTFSEDSLVPSVAFFHPSLSASTLAIQSLSSRSLSSMQASEETRFENMDQRMKRIDRLIDRISKRIHKTEKQICARERALTEYQMNVTGLEKLKIQKATEHGDQLMLESKCYAKKSIILKRSLSSPTLRGEILPIQQKWLDAQICCHREECENSEKRRCIVEIDKEWRVTKNLIALTQKKINDLKTRLNELNFSVDRLQRKKERFLQGQEKPPETKEVDSHECEPALKKRRIEE